MLSLEWLHTLSLLSELLSEVDEQCGLAERAVCCRLLREAGYSTTTRSLTNLDVQFFCGFPLCDWGLPRLMI